MMAPGKTTPETTHDTWRVVTPKGAVRAIRVESHDVPQCHREPLYVEVKRDQWELVGGKETDDDVRRAIGQHIAAREILAPGELTATERLTEAIGAVAEGYRSGLRRRVLDALAGVRDASVAVHEANWQRDRTGGAAQCVTAIEEAMAAIITSG